MTFKMIFSYSVIDLLHIKEYTILDLED